MDTNIRRLIAIGAAAAAGFLTVGGMSLASAQDAPATDSTAEDSTDEKDENCPKDGRGGAGSDSPESNSETDPSVDPDSL